MKITRMKKIRLEQGLSQIDISRLTGLHPSTISLIETGRLRPTERQEKVIATALGWKDDPKKIFR